MAVYVLEEAAPGALGDDGERKTFKLIPEDSVLDAEVLEIKEREKPFKDDDGNPVVKSEWKFKVTGGEHDGRWLWGETGTKFVQHPDCRLFAWAQECLGTELPAGFSLNTDNLVGTRCRIVVGQRTYTKKGATEPTTVNTVTDVMRVKTSGAAGFDDPF